MKQFFRCLVLAQALTSAFAGVSACAASATGTTSATVVNVLNVGKNTMVEILMVRLPNLMVLPGLATTDVSSYQMQAELEAIQRQCGEGNVCCNPPSDGRLEGDPANNLFLDTVKLREGTRCRLTVIFN